MGRGLGFETVNGDGENGAGHVGLPVSVAGPIARAGHAGGRTAIIPVPVPPMSVGGFTTVATQPQRWTALATLDRETAAKSISHREQMVREERSVLSAP